MRRRDFIVALGGAAGATWPTMTRAQQEPRKRRIGVLMDAQQNNRSRPDGLALNGFVAFSLFVTPVTEPLHGL